MARRRDYSSRPHCTCKTRTRSLYLVPWNAATLKPVFRFKRHVHINDQKASSSLQIVRGFDHAYFWHGTSRNVPPPLALNIQVHASDSEIFVLNIRRTIREGSSTAKQSRDKFRAMKLNGGGSSLSDRKFGWR